ncbi:pyridoxamine 5'-phosphate oxidase family protein [Bacillus gobiensis]|uniref:pyridoxamine 5'-phosphate oxidase family protein n=1 Tax=Bacillus gobiensis TaxID=1441095 RepID=UPI003D1EA4EA
MMPMRFHFLECKDEEKIQSFLNHARVGYLGLAQKEQPYVVPLNYVWWQGKIYFHGADTGRKIDMIKENPQVCFTVSEEYGTIANPVPAKTDTAYMSVMAFGKAHHVTDLTEATEAMQQLLNKYVPGYFDTPLSKQHIEKYRSSKGSATSVISISVEHLSAKENPLDKENKFYPGRERKMDL